MADVSKLDVSAESTASSDLTGKILPAMATFFIASLTALSMVYGAPLERLFFLCLGCFCGFSCVAWALGSRCIWGVKKVRLWDVLVYAVLVGLAAAALFVAKNRGNTALLKTTATDESSSSSTGGTLPTPKKTATTDPKKNAKSSPKKTGEQKGPKKPEAKPVTPSASTPTSSSTLTTSKTLPTAPSTERQQPGSDDGSIPPTSTTTSRVNGKEGGDKVDPQVDTNPVDDEIPEAPPIDTPSKESKGLSAPFTPAPPTKTPSKTPSTPSNKPVTGSSQGGIDLDTIKNQRAALKSANSKESKAPGTESKPLTTTTTASTPAKGTPTNSTPAPDVKNIIAAPNLDVKTNPNPKLPTKPLTSSTATASTQKPQQQQQQNPPKPQLTQLTQPGKQQHPTPPNQPNIPPQPKQPVTSSPVNPSRQPSTPAPIKADEKKFTTPLLPQDSTDPALSDMLSFLRATNFLGEDAFKENEDEAEYEFVMNSPAQQWYESLDYQKKSKVNNFIRRQQGSTGSTSAPISTEAIENLYEMSENGANIDCFI